MLTPSFDSNKFRIVYEHITVPLDNSDVIWPCPLNTIVQPIALCVSLYTDANVGNRYYRMAIQDVTHYFSVSEGFIAQPASTSYLYSSFIGAGYSILYPYGELVHLPMPDQILLEYGNSIIIQYYGKEVGDRFGAISLMYKQWTVQQ